MWVMSEGVNSKVALTSLGILLTPKALTATDMASFGANT
jgi:hypothetical protein